VRQVQRDEWYAVLRDVKDGQRDEHEALTSLERSPRWGWTAMDPASTRRLAIEVGDRRLAMAPRLVQQVGQVVAPGGVPLLLTDGCKNSLTALLTPYGQWGQLPRRQDKGPAPTPRWMPLPQLLSAHVVKTVRRRRLVKGRHRVVFGTLDAGEHGLLACGRKLTTALVERLNLPLRPHGPAGGRRVHTRWQAQDGLRQPWALCQTSDNSCWPHASLRPPLLFPEPPHRRGSATRWPPRTPAMAAGLTEHVWTLREGWLLRVPPWPQPAQG
jgi:hypothetical protein